MKLATIASSILATSFVALAGAAVPSIASASPNDGMVCRPGYTGALSGTKFFCSKTRQVDVALECANLRFPTKVIRAPGAPGDTSGGKDLCTRAGIVIGTTDALTGLVQGQDFVFASVNQATVTARVTSNDQSEAQALGLNVNDVDTAATQTSVVVNGGFGSNDVARVTLTFHTFAIPALASITLPPVVLPTNPSLPNLPRLP
jgi:hypothetical protein